MRYFICFSYDGSRFYGFQRQKDKCTVQKKIEDALTIINKRPVLIKGAGRTDALVHAYGQCAHFDLEQNIPCERLLKAINRIVYPYITITNCIEVPKQFHARFDATGKEYVYKIWLGQSNPFIHDYYYCYDSSIYIKKFQECANLFLGKHDFHNFVAGVRRNYNSEIFQITFLKKKQVLEIRFYGKSFYRYMVRNLVGAMLDYHEGKVTIAEIEKMLMDPNYHKQLRTAEAQGLYLEKVFYDVIR